MDRGFAVTPKVGENQHIQTQLIPHVLPERPVLLLLDNHACHIDIRTFELAKVFSVLSSASHLIQPLDVTFFGALKFNWNKQLLGMGHGPPRCGSGAA